MPRRDDDLAGLDVVRVVAIGLVTVQHALTLLERDEWTLVAGLSIGQVGVALFLVVSGLLAGESRRPPLAWLVQRLRRLFPAYWIAVGASIVLAGVVGHKPFGAGQVLAQLLGIGLFTHGTNLINTPTWFVSLLLVCYLGTFAVRLVRAPLLVGVAASLTLAILVGTVPNPWLFAHGFCYALASTLALVPRTYRPRLAWLCAGGLVVLAVVVQTAFGYAAVALAAVELSLLLRSVPRPIRVLADYSYEYYLVHGPALYAMIRWLPSAPLVAIGCAVVLAAAAAVVLRRIVGFLERVATRRAVEPDRSPESRT